MALSDYRRCDVCGHKAFYDANLNYRDGPDEYNAGQPYRIAGDEQYDKPELVEKYGMRLDYVGDWAVICGDCAKTNKCAIVPIEAPLT